MKQYKKNVILILMTLTAVVLFFVLYVDSGRRTESKKLTENKDIYEQDNSIYDVYITVFPTKDNAGEVLDFSAFSQCTSENRTYYNPVLDCNVQILGEGEKPDVKTNIDCKNASIRVRGGSTRSAYYKSYKIKLESNAEPFFGQTNLNVNKNIQDELKIATKLQTDLLKDIDDIFSYRTYFMRVWIRDASLPKEDQEFQYQGLYTEVEQPNEDYIKARDLDENTAMYKANNFAFALSDELRDVEDPGYNKQEFETVLGIQSGTNHKKLLEMLEAVNDMSLDFEEVFQTYFDEDNYLTWLAFNLLMGNEDVKSHNYIFFSPSDSRTWYFLPWDFDGALHFERYKDSWNHRLTLKSIQGFNVSVLHRRYFRMEGSIEKLQEKMEELLDGAITKEKVTMLVDSYKGVLGKIFFTASDVEGTEMTPQELGARLDSLHEGMVGCYELYKQNILYPAPMFVAKPEKQEDGSLRFVWDPSYSYQGLSITYKVEVFDAVMEGPLFSQEGIVDTSWILKEELEPGTYFVRVSAIDSEGHEQIDMEQFDGQLVDGRKINVYGLLEFKVE